jgi:hypothetical protein
VTPSQESYTHATDPMRVTLYKCGECEEVSSDDAWQGAWWSERSRRMGELRPAGLPDDERGENFGMGDTMVCPRCGYVHRDGTDESWVEELAGVATVVES